MRGLVRAGLIVLAAIQVVLGVWTLLFPASFYNDVPTVDWTPPYSEHLFRDFGGATLGLAVVVIAAAIWLERRLVIVALLAYLAFSFPHAIFHAEHLEGDSPVLSAGLLIAVVLSVLLPFGVIALAVRALPRRTVT
ncbi:hypothetical protein [Kribbella sp. VKM Ac-2568]|uniref:hypothetical protein n=1 Tax=Kribbella sp. VKM Ac-2568 TaxID=2512219 RepID=UPI00104C9675|nr:hypothetical protein [Kribbella sp. VKM Ac-2568]